MTGSAEGSRVLIVATTVGYQIRSFGEAASRLGVQLMFASDRCDQLEDPWWDTAVPVRFHDTERSLAAVQAACGDCPPGGVVAVGDRPAELAAHVAHALGLAGHPPGAAGLSRNKLLTRRALRAAGLAVPWFELITTDGSDRDALSRVPYPAVVKPLALSGSQGVIRVDDEQGLRSALSRVSALLRSPDVRAERDNAHDHVLVESFIPGREYAVEGLLNHGILQVLALFDKPDPLDGPFFEETIYRTPSVASQGTQERIVATIEAAVRVLGLRHGPVHAECRVNDAGVFVLEVAARPIGGLCARALRFRRGCAEEAGSHSLEEVLLRHALGEDVSSFAREAQASGVMMIPIPHRGVYRRVEGLDDARAVVGVEEVLITVKEDSPIVPLPEGRSYLGFIFAKAEEPALVDRALREAHARLRFVIDRSLVMPL